MGVACDLPSHTYQFSFCENTEWTRFYSPGAEIREYLNKVTDHYNLRPLIKLKHQVTEARWDQQEGKWHVKVKDLKTGQVKEDTADFVAYATGLLSKPQWPKLPGREKYKGLLHHSSGWDAVQEEIDNGGVSPYKGKRVGVIGTGSSAIQIVPVMKEKIGEGGHLINLGKSRTWLTGGFAQQILQ